MALSIWSTENLLALPTDHQENGPENTLEVDMLQGFFLRYAESRGDAAISSTRISLPPFLSDAYFALLAIYRGSEDIVRWQHQVIFSITLRNLRTG